MTAYFDQKHDEVRKAKELALEKETEIVGMGMLEMIDRQVVHDVSVCTEAPGFPSEMREPIHRTILKGSFSCQPSNQKSQDFPNYEDVEDFFTGIEKMIWELHTHFHNVALLGHEDFWDDPRSYVMRLASKADQYREEIVATPKPIDK